METYLSIEGLAKHLGVSEKGIRKWVLNREIPYRKVMRLVRFRLSEIEQWIDSGGNALARGDCEGLEDGLFEEDAAYCSEGEAGAEAEACRQCAEAGKALPAAQGTGEAGGGNAGGDG